MTTARNGGLPYDVLPLAGVSYLIGVIPIHVCGSEERSPSAANVVPVLVVVRSSSSSCCYQIFENSLRLCQYVTDRN